MLGKRFGKDTIIGVANVESSSVSFSMLDTSGGASAKILAHTYAELPLEERNSGQHLFALKQRLADIAKATLSEYAVKSGNRRVSTIYVIVHAPWAGGSVINAAIHFQKEEHVTSKIIAECAARAVSQDHSENVLDVRQLRIMLNGYKTAQPEGKYAHLVEVAGMRSTCDPKVKDEIVEALHAVALGATIVVHSGAWAVVESLPLSHESQNLVCLHISGEGTEIIVVRGGIISGYGYIGEGLRTIFSRAFPGLHPDEARAAARRMSRGEASEGAAGNAKEAFLKAEPALAAAFGEGLAKMSAQTRLPNTMLLIVDQDIAPWLQKFFERLDFSQFTVTAQPFSVRMLSAKNFGSLDASSEPAATVEIAIAASHVLKEFAAA